MQHLGYPAPLDVCWSEVDKSRAEEDSTQMNQKKKKGPVCLVFLQPGKRQQDMSLQGWNHVRWLRSEQDCLEVAQLQGSMLLIIPADASIRQEHLGEMLRQCSSVEVCCENLSSRQVQERLSDREVDRSLCVKHFA